MAGGGLVPYVSDDVCISSACQCIPTCVVLMTETESSAELKAGALDSLVSAGSPVSRGTLCPVFINCSDLDL